MIEQFWNEARSSLVQSASNISVRQTGTKGRQTDRQAEIQANLIHKKTKSGIPESYIHTPPRRPRPTNLYDTRNAGRMGGCGPVVPEDTWIELNLAEFMLCSSCLETHKSQAAIPHVRSRKKTEATE